ncbi:MAG: hypothetical protein V1702_06730 [Candidatus Woesearchaeota archaeon]
MADSSNIGRKALVIFLVLLAIIISAFIFINGMGSYNQAKGIAEEGMGSAEQCFRQLYTVDSLSYDGNTLGFQLKHLAYSDAEDIPFITVVTDKVSTINVSPMPRGMSKSVKVENVNIGSNFSVYAGNCVSYRVVCDMGMSSCK